MSYDFLNTKIRNNFFPQFFSIIGEFFCTLADWEMRQNASGLPMYFDHQNKVVMLDRPSGFAGTKMEGKIEGLRETGKWKTNI